MMMGKLIKQRLTFVKDVFRSFLQQMQVITDYREITE
jgi:hypothetical protein